MSVRQTKVKFKLLDISIAFHYRERLYIQWKLFSQLRVRQVPRIREIKQRNIFLSKLCASINKGKAADPLSRNVVNHHGFEILLSISTTFAYLMPYMIYTVCTAISFLQHSSDVIRVSSAENQAVRISESSTFSLFY